LNQANPTNVKPGVLIELFYSDPARLGIFSKISADELPQPERKLLAHDHHMTVTLEGHHHSPVDVRVMEALAEGDVYSRKILLTRKSDQQVVQFGIVRLDLSVLEPVVRKEIESQQTPLGRILIRHDVLRQVKLSHLYRISAGRELANAFGIEQGGECFGRTALIYCNGSPAVELLEIVGNC
jgi:chorismate-pyruvate lyase